MQIRKLIEKFTTMKFKNNQQNLQIEICKLLSKAAALQKRMRNEAKQSLSSTQARVKHKGAQRGNKRPLAVHLLLLLLLLPLQYFISPFCPLHGSLFILVGRGNCIRDRYSILVFGLHVKFQQFHLVFLLFLRLFLSALFRLNTMLKDLLRLLHS